MNESILTSIKKMLGITAEYTHFDQDIMIHINSVFMNLRQIGVGPAEGFYIEDESYVWEDFVADKVKYPAIKSYMYLKVRLLFDPPANSTLVTQFNQEIDELEWRLNHEAEMS